MSNQEQFLALADSLLAAGCIKFGEFTLKSGLKSPKKIRYPTCYLNHPNPAVKYP